MNFLYFAFFLFAGTGGSKILAFFPMAGPSHQIIFHDLVQNLARKGHFVTFVTPFRLKSENKNVEVILVDEYPKPSSVKDLLEFGRSSVYEISSQLSQLGLFVCRSVFSSSQFQDLITSNRKFDLILFESLFVQESFSALTERFEAPGVDVLGHGDFSWVNQISGLPDNPSYMVDFKSKYTDEMNFFERAHNFYITITTSIVRRYYLNEHQKLAGQYFKLGRPLSELVSDKALILVNSHHSTSYPFPTSPHVKHVGGLHIKTSNSLPNELEKFMNESEHGVVYISFGTNVNMTEFIGPELLESLMKLFGTMEERILWKWGNEIVPKSPPNVKLSQWFPQQDILSHRKTKAFVTHGGYLSITEAVYHGVPIIGIPFYGDQPKNMIHATIHGYGLTIQHFNAQNLFTALDEILHNQTYKNEILKRSALFKDRQMRPMEEAVFWIEYVLRNGKILQPYSVQLPFYILYSYDVICAILSLFIVLISLIWFFKKGVDKIKKD